VTRTPSGHNWVQGQGSGPRLKGDNDDEEEKFGKLNAFFGDGEKLEDIVETGAIPRPIPVYSVAVR
jgi:hypothetical protein